jgi:hypothetical protein
VAAVDYLFPDLAPDALVYDGRHVWFRPIFAWVGDYTSLNQNEASLTQVGKQDDTAELRAGRIGFALRSKTRVKWEFYVTADYQERRTREVGVGLKRRGADSGMMRFSGRPESNATAKYVNTKDFPARAANQVSLVGVCRVEAGAVLRRRGPRPRRPPGRHQDVALTRAVAVVTAHHRQTGLQ